MGEDVVPERQPQVLTDRPDRRPAQNAGGGHRPQVGADERHPGARDGDVRPGAQRDPDVGRREGWGVVDPVPAIATTCPSFFFRSTTAYFSTGSVSAITSSIPSRAATARAVVSLSR